MILLFDIGGTKMRIAVSRDGESFGEPHIEETPKNFDEGMELFKKDAQELCHGEKIKAAGGGIAGPLDKEKTKLINSPNLPDWINKPLKEELSKALDAPVYIANDAAIVVLGTEDIVYPQNLAFHRGFGAIGFIDLDEPAGATIMRKAEDGISMRMWLDRDINTNSEIFRFDVLFGYKTVVPRWGCRIYGV